MANAKEAGKLIDVKKKGWTDQGSTPGKSSFQSHPRLVCRVTEKQDSETLGENFRCERGHKTLCL